MNIKQEIIDSIKIIVDTTVKKACPQITFGTVVEVKSSKKCIVKANRIDYELTYYGDNEPNINQKYPVFVPFGKMSLAFIISGGSGGSGGTTDYNQLSNRPLINDVTLSGNKTASQLGLASEASVTSISNRVTTIENKESGWDAKYSKPSGGIPKTDLASTVQASLDRADSALQTAPVTSVNNKTGAVMLTPADLGIGSVFQLKGSKSTVSQLPSSGNTIGDVWYVVAESVGYIWLNDGTTDRWEKLGMEIDLSAYSTTVQMNSAILAHHDSTKYDASNPANYQTNTQVAEAIAEAIPQSCLVTVKVWTEEDV